MLDASIKDLLELVLERLDFVNHWMEISITWGHTFDLPLFLQGGEKAVNRRCDLVEFEAEAQAQVGEDRAGQRAGCVPNNVVDVGHARWQEVLAGLDGARECQAQQDGE